MRTVLHVIDTTGPGGAETIFIDLATRLARDKYRSIVSIRGRGWVYEELERRGIRPVLMDAKGSFNWRYLLQLVGLIRRENIDLIQSHLLGSNVYCAMAGLITRRPVVATFHGTVDINNVGRFGNLKFGLINAGTSCIVVVSDSLCRDVLGRTPLKKAKIKMIYNGIVTADYQRPRSDSLRQRFGWSGDDIVIGSLGNIRPAKGYDTLLQAAAILKKSRHSCRFVIAGQHNTRLYDDLLRLRDELDLGDRVQFLGYVEDAAGFLSSLDLFLSSSLSEGLPLAAIQAMVAGLPIIATRCGGYTELINDRENGWLVETGNPHAIAMAVEKLAGSPELRTDLGDRAHRYAVETFGMDTMLASYAALYDRFTMD